MTVVSRRRWPERIALAIPLVVAAGWLGALLVAGGDETNPAPIAVQASGPTFASLGELVAASDVVVVAEVTGLADGRTITDPVDPGAGIRTRLVTVEVSQALAGDVPAVLVVEEEASLLDGTPIVVNGVQPSQRGDRGVYFLVAGDSPDAPYHALVNEQGRYLLDGAALRPAATDALSVAVAALGLDGVIDAIG